MTVLDARTCAGCLGSRECWVCLGTGAHDTEQGVGACGSCAGSRLCRYCEALPAPRRGDG